MELYIFRCGPPPGNEGQYFSISRAAFFLTSKVRMVTCSKNYTFIYMALLHETNARRGVPDNSLEIGNLFQDC